MLSVALCPIETYAQRPTKSYQIGYLITGPQLAWANRIEALRAGLRDLGYVEGKNLTIIFRSGPTAEHLPELAAEFVRLKVDAIFATASTEVEAVRRVTKTIPVVFATHADPVGVGHVASLRRPGGNVTGLSMLLTELTAKELEILKETLPHVQRVGVLLTSWAPSHVPAAQMLVNAAQKLGVQLVTTPVQTAADFDGALALMVRERVKGFIAVSSPLVRSQPAILAESALKHQLPSMFAGTENVEAGGLMSYAPDLVDLTRRAATYIDKILKGANPGDLPVEQASKYELVINLKTAKALGLTIPAEILIRADRVIR
jgi:putative ABC transport system substrate-binding protein